MNSLLLPSLLLLAGVLGWMLRGALGGSWRSNRRPHRLADSRYCWVEVVGEWHAFTAEALIEARQRAIREEGREPAPRSKVRGVVDPATLVAIGVVALAVGIFAGAWKPLKFLQKKPPTEQLTQLQADLAKAQAELEAARQAQAQAAAAERARQEEQVRYAQQMTAGAAAALDRQPEQHRTPQTQLASELVERSGLALGLAIGNLPAAQQAEILAVVDKALSGVAAERDAARAALAVKDAELRRVSAERDAIQAELPTLQARLEAKDAEVRAVQAEVTVTTEKVKVFAQKADEEARAAGSFSAQLKRIWNVLLLLAGGYVFLAFVLPGLLKHLDDSPLKRGLRHVSGYLTAPLLHHDAAKKLSQAQASPSP